MIFSTSNMAFQHIIIHTPSISLNGNLAWNIVSLLPGCSHCFISSSSIMPSHNANSALIYEMPHCLATAYFCLPHCEIYTQSQAKFHVALFEPHSFPFHLYPYMCVCMYVCVCWLCSRPFWMWRSPTAYFKPHTSVFHSINSTTWALWLVCCRLYVIYDSKIK